MIKTINLTGSEVKVTELGGDNTEIFNNGSGVIYASKLPNITAGGDEVIAIPAGAIDGLYGTHGTVYLLGTGSVELRGVDHKITKSRGQFASGNGGEGVSANYVDEKCSVILDSAKQYADSLNAELTGYIGYTGSDIYGLEADYENCVFTRLAGAVGKTAGADFDSVNAYGGRRRCNLSDSGEVLAYYGDENFKADGSNGQVMVEQPKFYYRVVPLKTEKIDGADGYHLRKARYYISDTPRAGFKVHPAFVRNGVEVDKIYLSAFEGCIYDTSVGTYLLEDEQVADFDNDKLSSIAGAKPCSGSTQQLTRTNARKLVHNRGEGWEQATIQTVSATQLLFLIEYATFESQSEIGEGFVKVSDDGKSNMSEKTGATIAIGNNSGKVSAVSPYSISYRGEENFWGNIWTWVDGVNIDNPVEWHDGSFGKIYISTAQFNDLFKSATEKFSQIVSCYGSGYISAFGFSYDFDWLFIPTERSGNTMLPIGDYSWNSNSGERAAAISGCWFHTFQSGAFTLSTHFAATIYSRYIGTRLTYIAIK